MQAGLCSRQPRLCSALLVAISPLAVNGTRRPLGAKPTGAQASAQRPRLAGGISGSSGHGALSVRSHATEPFKPSQPFHRGVVDPPEPEPPAFFGLTASDVMYYINIAYWSCLLLSVLTGNDLLSRIVHFENYTTAMFGTSVAFTLFHTIKFARDLQQHLQSEARRDWRQMLRYCWNAIFWLGFVLWYTAPPVTSIIDYTGTVGAVMCLFGAALALTAALQVGMFSFMGQPQIPRQLQTGGIYALLRHPQALGNMCFLIGFSLAGGALWASLTFMASFAFYIATVVPAEERMLREAYGDKYERYCERTPRFAWALILLLLLECTLLWRFQPWAVPIDATPPPVLSGSGA